MPRLRAAVPSRRLTVFLLHDVLTAEDAITSDQPPIKVALDPGSGLEGAFYFKSRPATAPNWLSFVRPILSSDPNVTSSSSSAVLVLKAGAEFFALTFGFGRSLLDQTKIERQFGLKVALNRVNPDQIRSIDAKTLRRSRAIPPLG